MSSVPYCLPKFTVASFHDINCVYPGIQDVARDAFKLKGFPVCPGEISRSEYIPTVYFLFYSTECVYVGQSGYLLRRIGDHRRTCKVFDAFSYINVKAANTINFIENYYIYKLNPFYNSGCNNPNSILHNWFLEAA